MSELESCPSCGALPCDWVENPHTKALNAQPLAADALDAGRVDACAKAMCNAAWASVGEDWSLASDEQQDEFRLMARACLALSSGKTVGGPDISPARVNETPKIEHDGKTVGAGEGGDG